MADPRVLIVGGCGYVGRSLADRFISLQWNVLLLGRSIPPVCQSHYSCNRVDVTQREALVQAICDFQPLLVIHLASYGTTPSTMLDPLCYDVNIHGVEHTIQACLAANVLILLYASSINVVFGGEEIHDGDETMPYYPIHQYKDTYSASKNLAEKLVIHAHGSQLVNGVQYLRTGVIRLPGIYGEEEQRHLPDIIKMIDLGFIGFKVGEAWIDWVHIENIVQAFEKLAIKLLKVENFKMKPITLSSGDMLEQRREGKNNIMENCHILSKPPVREINDSNREKKSGSNNSIAGMEPSEDNNENANGRCPVYFITDGEHVNAFEFFRALCIARDAPYPELVIPVWLPMAVSYVLDEIHAIARQLFHIRITPLLTRSEVMQLTATHTFTISKARRELGYEPTINSTKGVMRVARKYANNLTNDNFFRFAAVHWWILIPLGMGALGMFACDPTHNNEQAWNYWAYESIPNAVWSHDDHYHFSLSSTMLRFLFITINCVRLLAYRIFQTQNRKYVHNYFRL